MDIIKLNGNEEKNCFVCGYKLQCNTCHNLRSGAKKQNKRKKRKTFRIPVESGVDMNDMHVIFEGYFNDGEIQNLSMICSSIVK